MTTKHPPQITESPQDLLHDKACSPPPGQEIDGHDARGRWLIYNRLLVLSSTEEPSSGTQPSSMARQHETICVCHCARVGNRWEAFCRGHGVHHCISRGGSGDSSNEPASWDQPQRTQDRRRACRMSSNTEFWLHPETLTGPESSPATLQPQASTVSCCIFMTFLKCN